MDVCGRGARRALHVRSGARHAGRRSAIWRFHLGHHGAAQARRSHARELSGGPARDDVLARSARGGMYTRTSALPAGRNTRGAASSRLSTRARRCSWTPLRGSPRSVCSARFRAPAWAPCARRPPCGAGSSRAIPSDRGPPRSTISPSAGEPLSPEVIARVRAAWGLTIGDGFGQSETTALAGNTPGQPVRPGSMGSAAPGLRFDRD